MKKGFTLVEIMASIIILSVIMMIGVGVYKQVDKKIREQQYKNKIIYIENQAALYGSETGYIETTVQILVNTGYIEADDKDGYVIDPRDKNKSLNHHVVEIRREGENYYGHFLEDKQEKDTNNLDQTNKNLEIIVTTKTGQEIEENDWTKEDVILTYEITGNKKNEKPTKVIWFDNINSLQGKEEDSITVEPGQFLNTEYRVEVTFEDGTKYEAKRIVKIDKQAPVIYKNNIKIEKKDEWTNKPKNVTILASDQNGSGIAGYAVVSENEYKKCNQIENYEIPKDNPEIYEKELDQGEYYICVKDYAGNYNDGNVTVNNPSLPEIKVDIIDTSVPKCKIEVVKGQTAQQKGLPYASGYENWYVEPISFRVVEDEKDGNSPSGILKRIAPKDITTDAKNKTVVGQIINGAGTIGKCELTVSVDVKEPSCTLEGEPPLNESGFGHSWAKDREIEYQCSDGENGSGCQPISNSTMYFDESTHPDQTVMSIPISPSKVVYDNVGRANKCASRVNVWIDNEAPTFLWENIMMKDGNEKGAYNGDWTTYNVQSKVSAQDRGIGVSTFSYSTTGDQEGTGQCPSNGSLCTSKIKENGQTTLTYYACDAFNNCRNSSENIKIDKKPPTVSCEIITDKETLGKRCNSGFSSEIYCKYTDEGSGIGYRENVLVKDSTGEHGMGAECSNLGSSQSSYFGDGLGSRHDNICGYPQGGGTLYIYGLCDKLNHCVDVTVTYTNTKVNKPVYTEVPNSCPKK